jgi:AsmA-like C-terminal region
MPIESVQNLSGIITADVAIKTLMSYIDKKQYEKVNMQGILGVNNMNVQAKGYPSVLINNLAMKFTPNSVDVGNFTAQLGKSDIQASGNIDNILAFFSTTKTMTGKMKFTSNLIDANEWTPAPKGGVAAAPSVKTAPVDKAERPFDRFDFTLDGKINKLVYEKYDIQNSAASGHFTPNKFVINNFQTQIGNSDISGNGTLIGVFDWLFEDKLLGGTLNLNSNMMDLNQFMTETPAPVAAKTVNTPTEPFLVPENIDLTVNAKMNRVLYTNMDLTNVTGILVVKDEEVKFEDASANALGGRINIKGGYNTQDAAKPAFKLAYDMKGIDFKQAFNTFNTFQKLAPIGQYLTGKFNTNLDMGGVLGKDLIPDLSTLNASGFLQTLQGFITGLKPLEEIGNKLNISELKNLDVKDTKNWFEIQNGAVTLKDFDRTISKDINLTIGGTHSLSNEMNYNIKARVPRKRLESSTAGAAAGAAFNEIVSQAAKYGVNVKNSEFVNVQFTLTGSMLQPKIAMKVMSGDGQATLEDAAKGTVNAVVDKAKDTVLTRANEELEKGKALAKEAADRAIDSARNVANRQVEEAKAKAIEEAKKKAGEAVGGKAGEVLDKGLDKIGGNDKIKTQTDKVKDKLDKWDPFKKKPVPKDTTKN